MAEFAIAQLARAPEPGRVKTRMLSALSPERAAQLHAAMVLYICRRLCRAGPLQLWVESAEDAPVFRDCVAAGAGGPYRQHGADLGARMWHITQQVLEQFDKVILVGSDAPALDPDYLARARAALDRCEVVFGPAADGGYVLLGLSRPIPELFSDIPWGSDRVLQRSLEVLAGMGVTAELLETLPDIDRPEDLRHLPDDLAW